MRWIFIDCHGGFGSTKTHVAIVVPGACSESPCKAPWQIWSAGKLESAQKLQTTSQCLDVRCILELFSEDSSLWQTCMFSKWIFMIHYASMPHAWMQQFPKLLPHCFPPWDFSPTDSPSRRLWLYCFLRNRTNENFFFTCHGGRVQVAWLHPHRTACMYTTDFLMISLPAWFLQSCRSNRFVIEHASNMQSLLAYQLIRLNRRNPLQKLNRTYFCCTRWNH